MSPLAKHPFIYAAKAKVPSHDWTTQGPAAILFTPVEIISDNIPSTYLATRMCHLLLDSCVYGRKIVMLKQQVSIFRSVGYFVSFTYFKTVHNASNQPTYLYSYSSINFGDDSWLSWRKVRKVLAPWKENFELQFSSVFVRFCVIYVPLSRVERRDSSPAPGNGGYPPWPGRYWFLKGHVENAVFLFLGID